MNWIKVVDGLPAIDEPVFLWDGVRMWKGGRTEVDFEPFFWGMCEREWYNFSTGKWSGVIVADDDYEPTHWMRIPMPPTNEGQAKT